MRQRPDAAEARPQVRAGVAQPVRARRRVQPLPVRPGTVGDLQRAIGLHVRRRRRRRRRPPPLPKPYTRPANPLARRDAARCNNLLF